ncbi:nuclease Le1 [Dendrothele bispora CBS 962.96]|uniref:Nuclease Le1 n=1 Tax=Dendrothele bispora (strain CBS 962.96) TaxID=1314807 RepID=A0A4S8KWB2_DENBC|nr:nuclease Le1 [Dendrothele bispora CBS 962.96]
MKAFSAAALTLLSVRYAYAWGAIGHEAVGFVAMEFLAPNALSFVRSSLGSEFDQSLGTGATWADDVKSEAAFRWSADLHFVDAEDNPPSSCSVSESRDCGSGFCILTAIANYTTRVVQTSLSATQRQQALLFLDHFIGDIGQPLHVEADAVGGNDIDVTCAGSRTNLHSLWDSGMINRLLSANYRNSVTVWADALVTRIQSGDFRSLTSSWLSCTSTTEPARRDGFTTTRTIEDDLRGFLNRNVSDVSEISSRAITPLECPLVWARESNAFDCSIVFSYPSFSDLCTSAYFTNSVPVIEEQIAKQGYRLAAWLNVLFDGSTHLP